MIKANYHTHTIYSDGKNTIEEIVNCAKGQEFDIIGISDHAPVPFPSQWNMKFEKVSQYINEIKKIAQNTEDIDILIGMEIDYLDNLNNIEYFKKFGLDYTIGAVHYVGHFDDGTPFNIDKSATNFHKGLIKIYDGNIIQLATDYYKQLIKMVISDPPDIIAHLTLIEKFNEQEHYLDTEAEWYKELVFMALDIIKQSDCILELNARSWYKGLSSEFTPPLWVLKKAYEFEIPVTISGDVHESHDLALYWDDAIQYVKAAGYEEITIITKKNNRQIIKLD